MSTNEQELIFGKLAVKKGFLSREELIECMKRKNEFAETKEAPPSIKEMLLEAGDLTERQVQQIEQLQEKVTEKQDLSVSGYEFHEKLGEGATGAVYRATQLSLDRPVAVKVLYPSIIEDEEYLERFHREARTVGKLLHENIIQGIDVGEEDGVYYFVMEYVDGPSLKEVLEENGAVSEERARSIALQMARALKHAEKNDLIHRDVKPENIMFDQEGTVKLGDLGLAKQTDDQDRSVTQVDVTAGSTNYRSPEQTTGDDLDIRTDVYALGASLYHAVTGTVPFEADGSTSDLSQHAPEDLEPPKEREPALSNAFNAVIMKMMEKDPADRYTPDELITDLERIEKGKLPEHVQGIGSGSMKTDQGSLDPITAVPGRTSGLIVVAGVVITGIVGYLLYPGGSSTDSDPAASASTESGGTVQDQSDAGDKADSTSTTTDERSEERDTGDGDEKTEARAEHRETYEELQTLVNQFDGGLEEVRVLNERFGNLLEKTDHEPLKREIQSLREEFLEQQAEQYYKERFSESPTSEADLSQLAGIYDQLNHFPELYKRPSVRDRVQERKASIKQTIRDRLVDLTDTLRRQVENRSLSEADETFRTLDAFVSENEMVGHIGQDGEVRTLKVLSSDVREERSEGAGSGSDAASGAEWVDPSWNRRVRMTVNGSNVAGDLKGFPVYVDLSNMPETFFNHINGANEIRVTTADGQTQVPREVVYLNRSNQGGELHLKADRLSSGTNTTFYIYYDHPDGPGQPAKAFRAANVWSNGYEGVWHVTDVPDSNPSTHEIIDSTGNGNHGNTKGEMGSSDLVQGKMGGSLTFDGADDHMVVPHDSSLEMSDENRVSVSAWVNKDAAQTNQFRAAVLQKSDRSYILQFKKGDDPSFVIHDENWKEASYNQSITTNDWYHMAGTFDGSTLTLYLNGSSVATGRAGQIDDASSWDVGIAENLERNGRWLEGSLDELRVASVGRSSDWVQTVYNNQKNPSDFLSIGKEETKSEINDQPSVDEETPTENRIDQKTIQHFSEQMHELQAGEIIANWKVIRTNFRRVKNMWERNR